MICPKCNHVIKEGQLYCERCGYEIRIVPDFEAELENNINENLSGVVNRMNSDTDPHESHVKRSPNYGKKKKEKDPDFDSIEEDLNLSLPMTIVLCVLAGIVVIFVLVLVSKLLKIDTGHASEGSYQFYYEQALSQAGEGDYSAAIASLQDALHEDANHPEARMLIADFEVQTGDLSGAEMLYKDLFNYADYAIAAYDKYVTLLKNQGREGEICDALAKCEISEVLKKYPEYVSEPPTFSLPEGTYDEAQALFITTLQQGIIYYTTDGSEPGEGSLVFTGPIDLTFGNYTIKSIFVNQYGRMSPVMTAKYTINVDLSFEPVVTPAGGSLIAPEYIHVEAQSGCKVYYTVDGTVPTVLSTPYTRDLVLPLGKSNYNFICYDEYGKSSEVVRVEYHFDSINGAKVSTVDATLITALGLFDRGILSNTNGTKEGDSGIYSYVATHAFPANDKYYYLMTEFYTDATGNKYSTSVRYAVGASDGILYNVSEDNEGHYKVSAF